MINLSQTPCQWLGFMGFVVRIFEKLQVVFSWGGFFFWTMNLNNKFIHISNFLISMFFSTSMLQEGCYKKYQKHLFAVESNQLFADFSAQQGQPWLGLLWRCLWILGLFAEMGNWKTILEKWRNNSLLLCCWRNCRKTGTRTWRHFYLLESLYNPEILFFCITQITINLHREQ